MIGILGARMSPLRIVLVVGLTLAILVGLVVQGVLLFGPPPTGDAAGAGMERGFRNLIAYGLVPTQLVAVVLVAASQRGRRHTVRPG